MFRKVTLKHRGRGFSLVELLIVIAIILIIAAIAVPKLNKARMQAQEMAAIRHIVAIHQAQTQYYSQFGKFAQSMTELGPASGGTPGPSAADLLPSDLASGEKGGYKFVLQLSPTGYSVNANPVAFNNTGSRTFFSDQTLVIRQNFSAEPATANSPEIK
ncbi:MAG: prepilin-type N-terminal cleavage/methylation domain-containing protein [Bryobacteraceae bacterium]|nr:prepilin-type N-terminal cleavage/methylation domain-containing protein [Bryobacteraceae bacterium]